MLLESSLQDWAVRALALQSLPSLPVVTFVTLALSTGLVVAAIGLMALNLYRSHGYLYRFHDRNRALQDWVEFFLPVARRVRGERLRAFAAQAMGRAGFRSDWSTDHFIASVLVSGAAAALLSAVLLVFVLRMGIAVPLVITLLAMAYPALRLAEKASARLRSCTRDLSFFLDFMSLAISAGMDFNRALQAVIDNAPKSPIREEFAQIQRNMHLGMPRADALLEFERRMNAAEIKTFVQNMVQALGLGTNIADTLQTISSSFNTRRFQRAEEEAGRISVRMMIPMLCFILPVVMLMLLGPMMLSFVHFGQ